MRIKFEPSGTHIHKGLLKVRFDIYPELGDKTYVAHYIDQIDGEGNYTNKKILNPCLSHFIVVPETVTYGALEQYLNEIFLPNVIKTIDDVMVLPATDNAHLISPLMRSRSALTKKLIVTKDTVDLVDSFNEKMSRLELFKPKGNEKLDIVAGSIDLGSPAIDRDFHNYIRYGNIAYPSVEVANPAAVAGTVDTFKVWLRFVTGTENVFAGTFSAVGNVLTCTDSESVGNVPAGSEQTYTGLTIACNGGDHLGVVSKAADYCAVEVTTTSGSGLWWAGAIGQDYVVPGASTVYTLTPSRTTSIYATGTELPIEYTEISTTLINCLSSPSAGHSGGGGGGGTPSPPPPSPTPGTMAFARYSYPEVAARPHPTFTLPRILEVIIWLGSRIHHQFKLLTTQKKHLKITSRIHSEFEVT